MDKIRKGSSQKDSVIMLQELLVLAGHKISVDGGFGKGTDAALRAYQKRKRLVVDGVAGDKTWMSLFNDFPNYLKNRVKRHLTEADVERVAKRLKVELAAVKAVNEVESRGDGFAGGKPRILFEGHIFWRRLRDVYNMNPSGLRSGNEDVLYPRWVRTHYVGGLGEYKRLNKAKRIHEKAALESASWGLFQVMGFHWKALKYSSIKDFVSLMKKNEGEHLNAFARFVEANNLVTALRAKNWARFARGYNGRGYKKNKYDEKLARAYARHSAAP